ncbi:MAG: head GIN domain-containing protein [Candidatus Krumholzibacteriia bacterium]
MRARIVSPAAAAALLLLTASFAAAADHASLFKGGIFARGEHGSGTLVTRRFDVSGFDRIALDGGFDVTVTVGNATEVAATVDDNLAELFTAEVENGTLRLDWAKACRPSRKCRVTVAVPELKGFTVNGAGDVDISGVQGALLELRINGAGDMEVAGSVDVLELTVSGAGDVAAGDLAAQDVEVRVSGAGDATVRAARRLDATVSGVGDITYLGDPAEKRTRVSGVGGINPGR